MSVPAACFENIIGLSRTDCPCVEDAPQGANVSESGLYLDELPGLNLQKLNATQSCGGGGLWVKLERARTLAIEETSTELMACIAANSEPARGIGRSMIGEDKKVTAAAHKLTRPFHGLTLQTAKVVGGTFVIEAIGTAFKPTPGMPDTIVLNVYEREEDSSTPLATYVLPIEGNKVRWTEIEPLTLSMEALGMTNPRYWLLYEPYAGAQAMNSVINCGCGGFAPYWDPERPQYASMQQKQGRLWADWCMAAGTYGSDLASRDAWSVENATSGLLLRVRFDCDERSTFCTGTPNYATDPIQKVLAHAVRFRAGYNLLTDLLNSTEINRWTMTAGEQMAELRKEYESEWQKRLRDYLCPELTSKANINRYGDCRRCKNHHGVRRGTILN